MCGCGFAAGGSHAAVALPLPVRSRAVRVGDGSSRLRTVRVSATTTYVDAPENLSGLNVRPCSALCPPLHYDKRIGIWWKSSL